MKDNLPYILPFVINFARYFIFAGIPFLIFYKFFPQVYIKNKIQQRFAQSKDFLREILHSMQTTLILATVGLLMLKSPLRAYTQMYDDISDYSLWWIPVSVLLALVVHDTYFYWMHRASHHPKIYRHVHLLHHKSVNPSPWTSYSFHFFEGILEAIAAPIILLLIPMHVVSLIIFTIIGFVFNVYGHLGYEITPKWFRHSFFFKVMNTSTHHNIHHAKTNGNYGLYFRLWDRLMGTEHPDYVKDFDEIQTRRFASNAPSYSWKRALLFFALVGGLGAISTNGQSEIEGKWKDDKEGGIVLIYQENGLYFGQLIGADKTEENERIKNHDKIILMKNFKKKNDAEFCCGTIYQPREKRLISASLILENAHTLKINGQYGIFSGTRVWTKL